jgi:hypothetical protein
MSEVSVINQAEVEDAAAALDLPPGFRFHPTDEEIISHYLTPKALDHRFVSGVIGEVDLNKCEPWYLPGMLLSNIQIQLLFIPDPDGRPAARIFALRSSCAVFRFWQAWRRWGRRSGGSSATRTASTRRGPGPTAPPRAATGRPPARTRRSSAGKGGAPSSSA